MIGSLAHLLAESRHREREQWLPPEALAARRASRLRQLARAASRTRYYGAVFAGLGLAPGDLTEAGLERFPLLEKATLQTESPEAMTTRPPDGLSAVTTSGSTGVPVRVLRTARDQAAISDVYRIRQSFDRLAGAQLTIPPSSGRAGFSRQGNVASFSRV